MTVTVVTRKLHPLYHQLARVNQAWSLDKDQAYQRARATMNHLVLSGFITGGFWVADEYFIDPSHPAYPTPGTVR